MAADGFGGVIGRYYHGLDAVVAGAAPRAARRAERAAGRPRRRRLRAARLLRLRHRDAGARRPRGARAALHELPHHRALLADARLPAHRAQPPLERHGPRHRAGDRASPATTPASRAATASCPRCSCRTAMPRRRSASGISRRRTSATSRRRARAGRSAAASSASTASSAARRTSSRPRWCTTTTRSTPPRSIAEGYHLTEDLVDRGIALVRDLRADRRGQAVLHVLLHRRLPLAAPGAAPMDRALSRPLRPRLGRLARGDARAPDRVGLLPAGTELSPRPDWVPAWDALSADERRVYARYMEAFAGLPLPHRPSPRPPARVPRDDRRSRQHAGAGAVRQRRQLRGRPARLAQRPAAVEHGRRARSRRRSRASTRSADRAATTTIRGAGPWPATRRSGAGSARCTRAASPIR